MTFQINYTVRASWYSKTLSSFPRASESYNQIKEGIVFSPTRLLLENKFHSDKIFDLLSEGNAIDFTSQGIYQIISQPLL